MFDQRPPEVPADPGLVLGEEEVPPMLHELLKRHFTVLVGVDGDEREFCVLILQPQALEEQFELLH